MRPYLFEIDDYRECIRAMIQWHGTQNVKFSLRWFAKKLGFSSPSALSMVLKGDRNLTSDRLPVLIELLKLLPDEGEYLKLIYDMDSTKDPKEKQRLADLKHVRFRGGSFVNPVGDSHQVFDRWYYPAVRELVAFPDFKPDPFWMGREVGITPEEARDAFIVLIKIGLIELKDGVYVRSFPSIQPKEGEGTSRLYTQDQIARSIAGLKIDWSRRYYNTLTVAVSQKVFEQIPKILARLIAEIDFIAESDKHPTEVAQLNLQFYSLKAFSETENGRGITP